ncbi:MAG: hypothetical protein LUD29_06830 [Clostridia bacterium]|nr:hypothetical protein [Clostridia bacterium]
MGNIEYSPIEIMDWADVDLGRIIMEDEAKELAPFFGEEDSEKLALMTVLFVTEKAFSVDTFEDAYNASWLSKSHPGVSLSEDSVTSLLKRLEKMQGTIERYMKARVSRAEENCLLFLFCAERTINPPGSVDYYYQGENIKGSFCLDVCLFDVNEGKLAAMKRFPPDMDKKEAVTKVITDFGVKKAIVYDVISDVDEGMSENIHFIIRIEDVNAFAKEHNIDVKEKEGMFLLISDMQRPDEEIGNDYDFILTVRDFLSNYSLFQAFRNVDNPLPIAFEFIDFLSYVLMTKYDRVFCDAGLYDKKEDDDFEEDYNSIMRVLNDAQMVRVPPDDEWCLAKPNPHGEKVLRALGFLPSPKPEKRKPGRPKKSAG